MTLTRISLITGVFAAAANLIAVLASASTTTLAAVNSLFLAVGFVVHSWNDPDSKIPIGKKA